ncbi:ABC transporter substrate-binding protein [Microbacterium sp. CFBP 8801]|uniref:ABC transporter substrate-binding protein n=1 Tax=Microbacterium sp. CFBP 8801 TaxID=2774036 RepID=UPI001A7E4266
MAGVLAGCSAAPAPTAEVEGDAQAGGSTAYPLTVDNCGYEQTFTEKPSRVVLLNSMSVAEVETLILLGLEDTILANAQNYGISDHPDMVEKIDALPTGDVEMAGLFEIPAEQLFALKPDLVIATASGGFDPSMGQASREELAELGINTLVSPANCAMGKENPTDAEIVALEDATVESSFEFVTLVGDVFDKQAEAEALVTDRRARIDAVSAAVEGLDKPKALIVVPSMSMMMPSGMPAVFLGGIFDDLLARAGTTGSLDGIGLDLRSSLNINPEHLSSADVDLLVIVGFMRDEDLDAEAAKLFEEYPEWDAAKTNNYVSVSDGVYVGPTNAEAIEKIAEAAHPDAF